MKSQTTLAKAVIDVLRSDEKNYLVGTTIKTAA